MKKMYLVPTLKKEHGVSVGAFKANIELSWADGMIGVLPVFRTKKDANKYAGKVQILTIEEVEK